VELESASARSHQPTRRHRSVVLKSGGILGMLGPPSNCFRIQFVKARCFATCWTALRNCTEFSCLPLRGYEARMFLEKVVRRTVDAYSDRIVDVSIVVPEILSPKRRLTIFYSTLPRAFSGSVIFTALLLDTLPNAVKTKPIKQTFQDV